MNHQPSNQVTMNQVTKLPNNHAKKKKNDNNNNNNTYYEHK